MPEERSEKQDIKFMSLALAISKQNIGNTSPNPSVGCVISNKNIIISTGVTAKNGRPHAEEIALNKAREKAKGATIYITLEPCSHFGQTPPCVDSIIKSGISRVVIATIDPDKRVNGFGIKKLKEAKIEVVIGAMSKEAEEINKGFFKAKKLGKPFVTLKMATSLDGKIATHSYDSKWISNEKSRNFAHKLRSKNDAILIGSNTVKKDNPMLDCRILGLENSSPKRIILSSKLDMDLNSKIFQTANQIDTFIATNNSNYQKFLDLGVKILYFDTKKDSIKIHDLLQKLCDIGINNLLIEGGGKVASNFLKENLVDEVVWIKTSKIIGGDGINSIDNLNLEKLSNCTEFSKVDQKEFDEDTILTYRNLMPTL
jgi:diaminohydroxyphosphoribosylaminopyrimidine deaminase/5-amino-6-(5-phosphoribosylamino)uracil reductase